MRAKSEEWAARVVANCLERPGESSMFKFLMLLLTKEDAEEMMRRLQSVVSEYLSAPRKPGDVPFRLLLGVTPGAFVAPEKKRLP